MCLTSWRYVVNPQLKSILAFSEQDPLVDFAHLFLTSAPGEGEGEKTRKEQLRVITYECCVHDKPDVVPIVMAYLQVPFKDRYLEILWER